MKSGEYFEKDNNYGVNFDFGICISMEYIQVKNTWPPHQVLYFESQFLGKWPPFIVKGAINDFWLFWIIECSAHEHRKVIFQKTWILKIILLKLATYFELDSWFFTVNCNTEDQGEWDACHKIWFCVVQMSDCNGDWIKEVATFSYAQRDAPLDFWRSRKFGSLQGVLFVCCCVFCFVLFVCFFAHIVSQVFLFVCFFFFSKTSWSPLEV